MFILMELCTADLKQLQSSNLKFNETQLRTLIRDVSQVLAFLHSQGIAHMDIKPENIFLRKKGEGSDITYVLADFSISFHKTWNQSQEVIEGDHKYLAPELLCFDDLVTKDLEAADIYSFGMTLYHLMTGKWLLLIEANTFQEAIYLMEMMSGTT